MCRLGFTLSLKHTYSVYISGWLRRGVVLVCKSNHCCVDHLKCFNTSIFYRDPYRKPKARSPPSRRRNRLHASQTSETPLIPAYCPAGGDSPKRDPPPPMPQIAATSLLLQAPSLQIPPPTEYAEITCRRGRCVLSFRFSACCIYAIIACARLRHVQSNHYDSIMTLMS